MSEPGHTEAPNEAALYNVQKIIKPGGKVLLYFRKAGLPSIRLKSDLPADGAWEGSPLKAEVDAILATHGPKPLPGTLKAALRAYELEDPDFAALAPSTKRAYLRIIKELTEDFGHLPIASFKPAFLLSLRNTWAKRGHRTANINMQVLKNTLWPCVIAGQLGDGDPFAMIPQARRPADLKEPHLLWPLATVRVAIEAAIGESQFGLARAIAIGRFAGARRGDLVRIPKTARTGRPGSNSAGRIAWISGKRKVPVDMPEDPELTHWLTVTPEEQPKSTWQAGQERRTGVIVLPPSTLVYNTRNKRFTESGLGQALDDLMTRLHAAGKVASPDYNLHGLRHSFGVEAALAGCTDAQGAALMGHHSPNSFATYRRQADRIRMADDAADKIIALRERSANPVVNEAVNQL